MSEELKVALIGSAPASVRSAPYNDPSWHVWGCSPGAYGMVPRGRSQIWFELHKYEAGQTWFSPEYCNFLRDHPCVVVSEPRNEIPNGIVLDYAALVKKSSAYFFTSSIAWMMSHAIELGYQKIGLWGVDMAANEEYEAQRAGLHYFALIAAQRGIEVGVPPESDLFRPRFLYGVDENTHGHIKMRARREELSSRLAQAEQQMESKRQESWFLRGALDDLNYCSNTWPNKDNHLGPPVIEAPILQPFHQVGDVPVPQTVTTVYESPVIDEVSSFVLPTKFLSKDRPGIKPKKHSKGNSKNKIAAASLGPGHLV